jgi:hypothetical protein
MPELEIGPEIVGEQVVNPLRPEWGVGTVLRVQSTTVSGSPQHRVSVQFATGHRVLVAPPARLATPEPEAQRKAGWLDEIAGQTLDDRLVELPAELREFLGTPAQRIVAMAPLYAHDETPESLIKWARRQANVADPLTHWTRDELLIAFRAFCMERDSALRVAAALLKQKEGSEALVGLLDDQSGPIAEGMRAALRKPI